MPEFWKTILAVTDLLSLNETLIYLKKTPILKSINHFEKMNKTMDDDNVERIWTDTDLK